MRKTLNKVQETNKKKPISLTEYLDRSGEYIGLRQFEMYKDEIHTYEDWTFYVVPLHDWER